MTQKNLEKLRARTVGHATLLVNENLMSFCLSEKKLLQKFEISLG